MNHTKTLCPLAERALAVAGCVQMLNEAGLKIFAVNISDKEAVVSITYSSEVKTLNGKSAGITRNKGMYFFVYQKDIGGVLVRWLEPYFNAQQSAQQVH